MTPDGLDHGPNHGHYRVEAEYANATVHAYAGGRSGVIRVR